MNSSALMRTRSINASLLVCLPNTWIRDFTSVHCRNLLDCLLCCFLCRHAGGWNIPSGWEHVSVMLLVDEVRRPCQQAACSRPRQSDVIFWPIIFIQTFNQFMFSVSQRQLFSIYPFINIKSSSSAPFSPFSQIYLWHLWTFCYRNFCS